MELPPHSSLSPVRMTEETLNDTNPFCAIPQECRHKYKTEMGSYQPNRDCDANRLKPRHTNNKNNVMPQNEPGAKKERTRGKTNKNLNKAEQTKLTKDMQKKPT